MKHFTFSETFEKASKKLPDAEFTSALETDDNEGRSDSPKVRKRKTATWYSDKDYHMPGRPHKKPKQLNSAERQLYTETTRDIQ